MMRSEYSLPAVQPVAEAPQNQPRQSKLRLAYNPHLERLKRRHLWKKPDTRLKLATILPWLMLYSCGLLLTVGLGFVSGYHMWLAMSAITIILIVGVPFVVTSYAAILTATDAASKRYELLVLTSLSDGQLAWSYFYAVLWQFRLVLWIWAIFMTTTVVGVVWIATVRESQFDMLTLTLMLTSMMLQLGGICWGMTALAVAFAIRFPNPIVTGVAMPLATLCVMLILIVLVADRFMGRLLDDKLPPELLVEAGIFIVLPYGLLGVGLWLGKIWARRID